MKKQVFSPKNLVIMFAPVVFVLILLNLGLPQRYLTAVKLGEERYSVAAYNYYFCTEYYGFVARNYDELDDLGLNTRRSLKKQSYDGEMTWQQYFREAAIAQMRENAALRAAAAAAGFTAEEEIAKAVAEKAEELELLCTQSGIAGVDQYLTSYYDAGSSQELFYGELAKQVLAQSYREEIRTSMAPTAAEAEAYRAQALPGQGQPTVDVVVSFFAPAADRESGAPEARQWENAETLARAALARARAWGGDAAAFSRVARAYGPMADGPEDGRETALGREGLDAALADWCFNTARLPGDAAVLRGESGWYLVRWNGWGEDSLLVEARAALLEERYQAWLDRQEGDWPVSVNALAMLIAK